MVDEPALSTENITVKIDENGSIVVNVPKELKTKLIEQLDKEKKGGEITPQGVLRIYAVT